jgi:hypothetical protein
MKCWTCKNKQEIPGDCHIGCNKPPSAVGQIGSGGDERYAKAEKLAKENSAVIRCVWPGSGVFPFCFDGNTVFGCCNYEPISPSTGGEIG